MKHNFIPGYQDYLFKQYLWNLKMGWFDGMTVEKMSEEVIPKLLEDWKQNDIFIADRRLNPIVHNNPEDYGLTLIDSYKIKLRYLNSQKQELSARVEELLHKTLSAVGINKDFFIDLWDKELTMLEKIDGQISYTKMLIDGRVSKSISFDIRALKDIPIDSLFEINRAGFFINNPLREERSPSNSFHYDKKNNRWSDFATGEFGDLIDLVGKVNKCGFIDACKLLSNQQIRA